MKRQLEGQGKAVSYRSVETGLYSISRPNLGMRVVWYLHDSPNTTSRRAPN